MGDRGDGLKMVIVVRSDIRLSPGKLAAQVAHAAVTCATIARGKSRRLMSSWLDQGQKKVVLKVDTLKELEELERRARGAALIVSKVQDAGLTEVPSGTVTCIGIGPAEEGELDRLTGELRLA